MSDTKLNAFIQYGTSTARGSFTPAPASGTQPIYVWYETDTNLVYIYTTAWKGPYASLPSGYTTGDLLLGSGSNAVSRLAIGTNTYVLTSNGTTAAWAAPGGGGGGAWTNITGSVTVTGATVSGGVASVVTPGTSVSFSSIPGTYNHLALIFQGAVSDAIGFGTMGLRLNGDTAANYDYIYQGTVSGNASAQTSALIANLPGTSGSAGTSGSGSIWINNYAGTAFNKIATSNYGILYTPGTSASYRSMQISGQWRSTAAVTQVTLIDQGGGNFVAGSKFSLYGIT